jgi:threonine/homoserine/homoserine lactone efflux protein
MTLDLLLAFAAYAFVTSITPGPNNTMLLASGVNFGFWPSLPHMLGINLGFTLMVLTVGFGAGGLFTAVPVLHDVLRAVGAAYLLYLAWMIARSGPMSGGRSTGEPLSFLQAAAFQWVNPKAWIMAIGAISAYTPEQGFFGNILVVALVYMIVNGPCIAAWTGFGVALRRFLTEPAYVRVFNVAMALLLLTSLYPLVRDFRAAAWAVGAN